MPISVPIHGNRPLRIGLQAHLMKLAGLTDREMAARLQSWQPPAPRYTTGVMAKYARGVSSASEGAVTR